MTVIVVSRRVHPRMYQSLEAQRGSLHPLPDPLALSLPDEADQLTVDRVDEAMCQGVLVLMSDRQISCWYQFYQQAVRRLMR